MAQSLFLRLQLFGLPTLLFPSPFIHAYSFPLWAHFYPHTAISEGLYATSLFQNFNSSLLVSYIFIYRFASRGADCYDALTRAVRSLRHDDGILWFSSVKRTSKCLMLLCCAPPSKWLSALQNFFPDNLLSFIYRGLWGHSTAQKNFNNNK
eukprot:gene1472-861_t